MGKEFRYRKSRSGFRFKFVSGKSYLKHVKKCLARPNERAINGNTELDKPILQTIQEINDPCERVKSLIAFQEQVNLNNYDNNDNEDEYDEYTDDEEYNHREYYENKNEE